MSSSSKKVGSEKTNPSMFRDLLNLVGKLAGGQPKMRLDVENLKLNLEGSKVLVNGKVNLNIVYSEKKE